MYFLKKLKLATKITVGFSTILVLFVTSILFSYFGLGKNSNNFTSYRKISTENVLAGKIQTDLLASRISYKSFVLLGDDSHQKEFNASYSSMENHISELKRSIGDSEKSDKIDTILKNANEYKQGFEKIVEYKKKRDELYNLLSNKGPEIEKNISDIVDSAYKSNDQGTAYEGAEARRHLILARLYITKFLENNDQKLVERVKVEFGEMDKFLKLMEVGLKNSNERELLNTVVQGRDIYNNGAMELVSVIENTNSVARGLEQIGPQISNAAEDIKLSITREQDSYGPMVNRNNQVSLYVMMLLSILAVIFSILISIAIIKAVTKPVQTVTDTFKDISEGEANLDVRLKVDSNDELGDLAKYFNIFIDKLRIIILENKNQSWLKTGQAELNEIIRGEQEINTLSYNIITYIAKYLNAQVGVIYIKNEENLLKFTSSYAYTRRKNLSNEVKFGEGIVGQAALEKQTIIITNIPDDYIKVNSGTGQAIPYNILVSPCLYNGEVKCVIELGSFNKFTDIQRQFIESVGEIIATSINSQESHIKMQILLDKTLEQAEELRMQQEELRQSNEELEEQTIALKESEAYLQNQQEELRQTNEELEEQTKALKESEARIQTKQEELKIFNEKLEERTSALEMANKYKSEFLANVSHELRTPLNSIIVLSKLLADKKDNEPLTEKQMEFAATINSSGRDLLKLINDILDLSKVEAGKIDINIEKVSLKEFTNYIERSFRHVARSKGLDFDVRLEKGLPQYITTDNQRVQQIVNNLLSNAFKFTSTGKISLMVSRIDKGVLSDDHINHTDNISFTVMDTGIGIPKNKQSLIFDAFRQSDGTISRKYGGTGLGLSISKELAKLLGGKIYLNSEEGIGSTFTLVLPEELQNNDEIVESAGVEKQEDSAEEKNDQIIAVVKGIENGRNNNVKGDNSNTIEDHLNGKKVLIVDDDMRNVFALSSMLEEKGIKVIAGKNGVQGLEKLRDNEDVDLILMDIMMPEMNGYTAMREIRKNENYNEIPIIALTAKAMKEDRTKCLEAGADEYLTKPIDSEKLISLLRVWLYNARR